MYLTKTKIMSKRYSSHIWRWKNEERDVEGSRTGAGTVCAHLVNKLHQKRPPAFRPALDLEGGAQFGKLPLTAAEKHRHVAGPGHNGETRK